MNKREQFLERQRQLDPPSSLRHDIERSVMAEVRRHRPAPHYRRTAVVGFATILAVAAGVLILRSHREQPLQLCDAQFVESTIILDDHVCIWLEPVETSTPRSVAP